MKKIVALVFCITLSLLSLFSAVGCTKGQVSLKYGEDGAAVISLFESNKITAGLLPEPAATAITKKLKNRTWYRLDLQELYDDVNLAYPQAVLMVKQSVLKTYPEIVQNLQNAITESVSWAKTNTASAVTAISARLESGVTPSLNANNINSTVIDNCKIYWQGVAEAKEQVKTYVDDMIAIESLSAKQINDDFFYALDNVSGTFANESLTISAPDGAPAIALSKLMYENNTLGTNKTVNYKIVKPTNIGAQVQQGLSDIVIMPITGASKIYKAYNQDSYKMVSVITHGNLYILSNEQITINDLNGKVMGVPGQGQVPDLTLKAVLKKNNLTWQAAE